MQKKTLTPERAGLRILAVFLSVSMVSSNSLQISPVPPKPRVGEDVILSVTGIPNEVRFYDWYRGNDIAADNQILSYNRNDSKVSPGKRFFKEAEIQSNGSLKIVNVTKEFQDKYTFSILANGLQNKEVILEVDANPILHITTMINYHNSLVTTPGPNSGLSGGAIAGIVIAVVVVVIAAIVGGVYAFKFNKSG
ncbi:cell adhesion molecule CEACAM8-like isoform X2 [Lithobates pipiens]